MQQPGSTRPDRQGENRRQDIPLSTTSQDSSEVQPNIQARGPQKEGIQGNEREQELRKAMSLSYLKTEASAPKHEKIPKPENIAALREALLSVMKTEGITPAPTQSVSAPSTQATPEQGTQTNGVRSQAQVSNNQQKHHSTHSTNQKTNSPKDTEHKTSHKTQDEGVNHHGNVKHTSPVAVTHKDSTKDIKEKEVEGDVLKNIFEN
jgi:hypothetical protein